MARVVFKDYQQGQTTLFPTDLGALIDKSAPVRIVNTVVDKLDISDVLSTYKGGGTSAFHPKMMLKIIFFAYMNNVFSCRKIEKQLKENVNYMWLSGMQVPDFRTINNFRSGRLKDTISELFTQVVIMLSDLGCLSLEETYIDGTKIESRANKYTFVWRKSIVKYREKLIEKIKNILKQVDEGIAQDIENQCDNDTKEAPAFDKDTLLKHIESINSENLDKKKRSCWNKWPTRWCRNLMDTTKALKYWKIGTVIQRQTTMPHLCA